MGGAAPGGPVTILAGLDDPALDERGWDRLLQAGETDTVFLTRWWQTCWWRAFGRGRLLPVLLWRHGRPAALAPLFADEGMVFFAGAGGSDYLDLVGATPDPREMAQILTAAAGAAPGFLGFRLHHVPDDSRTGATLAAAAELLGMDCLDEGHLRAPAIEMGEAGPGVADRKSLRRHENRFAREGGLAVRHMTRADEILPRLDEFFAQHVGRWAGTPWPSLFAQPGQRDFYRDLARTAPVDGTLQFTELRWRDAPVAFHFGFLRGGEFLWYKPSFDIALARRSPGEALLRALLRRSIEDGHRVFDFGLGEEPFKARFATRARTVRTWGLYPRAAGTGARGEG